MLAGSAAAQDGVRIAVLPIVVHSSEDPEYLRAGLADMLASRLEQSQAFDVVRIEDAKKATTSLSQALESGRSVNADFVLFGSFTRFGQGASLDMHCAATRAPAGDETLREIFVHSGNIGAVIPDLDDLVGKVSRFAVSDFEDRLNSVSTAPPPGPGRDTGLQELRDRILALEEAIERLEAAAETAGTGSSAP